METLIDLTTRDEFRTGIGTGGIGAILIMAVVAFRRTSRPVPVWGVIATSAVWISIWVTIGRRFGLGVGLAVLSLAGWLWDRSKVGSVLAATIGSVLVVWRGGLADVQWIRFGAIFAIIAIGLALLSFARQAQVGSLVVPLLAITMFGVWATVPDTEAARIPLGMLVPLGLVAWPWRLSSLGTTGAFAIAGIIVWIAVIGGAAREGSIIGAWASAGVLLGGLIPRFETRLRAPAILTIHAGVVYLTARVAGFQEGAPLALMLAVPPILLGIWLVSSFRSGGRASGR
jgi:hypothetical protein